MLTLYYHVTITISLFFWVPLRAVRVFCHPHLTAPFTSDLGVPPGCLGGSVRCPPPSLLPGVLNLQAVQTLSVFSHPFPTMHFTSDLGVPPGCLGGTFIFVGLPRFVFGGNALYTFPSVGWRRGRRGRAGVAGLSFIGSWLWSDTPYARFVVVVELPDSPRFQAGGPYNVAPYLFLRRRPLTTLGHLPPTAVAESQWGEPRSDASGTSVGEEEGGVGQEWQAFSSLSLGRGAMVSIFPPPDSPRRQAGGTWSVAPCLFLRRRPLTTLGHPPPTAVAESQWGEPRSDAFGTGEFRRLFSVPYYCVLTFPPPDNPCLRPGGAWSAAPCLRRRPLVPAVPVKHDLTFGEDAAMVLGKEKETTEAYLSEDIVTVVACLLQCLQILCIINEFKAAAITYGLDKKSSRCVARSLFDPFTPMTFIIVWNGLYNANKEERNTVEERVQAHLVRRKLWRRKVKFAFMRPTGWHGESGAAESGGHITVDFCGVWG
ncbi:hypothetical protein EDB85DRAFT_1897792 [Lactarius pseudohatsudake]|nr:hypothetical protein EDB85DRAFT_1897792 [Lactarius pseudohatsudake]